jgi:hypothetical protein
MALISYPKPQRVTAAEHITIYYNPTEFCGWPFNHGFWAFPSSNAHRLDKARPENELLISFSRGPCSSQSK